jgi:hypothetical protein
MPCLQTLTFETLVGKQIKVVESQITSTTLPPRPLKIIIIIIRSNVL